MSTPIKPYDDPDWVDHCLWLIITKEANDELEKEDKLLKLSMALRPDVDVEDDAYANYGAKLPHPQM